MTDGRLVQPIKIARAYEQLAGAAARADHLRRAARGRPPALRDARSPSRPASAARPCARRCGSSSRPAWSSARARGSWSSPTADDDPGFRELRARAAPPQRHLPPPARGAARRFEPELTRLAAMRADHSDIAGAAREPRRAGAPPRALRRVEPARRRVPPGDRRDQRQPGADHRPRADHPAAAAGALPVHGHPRDGRARDATTTGGSSTRSRSRDPDTAAAVMRRHINDWRTAWEKRGLDLHQEILDLSYTHQMRSRIPWSQPTTRRKRESWASSRAPRRSPVSSTRSAIPRFVGRPDALGRVPHRRERRRARCCRRRWSRPTRPRVRAMVGRWQSNCVGDFYGGSIYVAARHEGDRGRVRAGDVHGQRRADDLRPRPLRRAEEDRRRATLLPPRRHLPRLGRPRRRADHRAAGRDEQGHRRLRRPRATTSTSRRARRPTASACEEDAILTRAKFDVHATASLRGRRQRRPARHRARPARRDPGPLGDARAPTWSAT